jgi:hypothetical protein
MCNHNCNQGRACTCAPGPLTVNLIATLIWLAALSAIAAVLLGVME